MRPDFATRRFDASSRDSIAIPCETSEPSRRVAVHPNDVNPPPSPSPAAFAPNAAARLLADYDRDGRTQGEPVARAGLFAALASQPEQDWLQCAQQLVLRGRADL